MVKSGSFDRVCLEKYKFLEGSFGFTRLFGIIRWRTLARQFSEYDFFCFFWSEQDCNGSVKDTFIWVMETVTDLQVAVFGAWFTIMWSYVIHVQECDCDCKRQEIHVYANQVLAFPRCCLCLDTTISGVSSLSLPAILS